MALGATQPRYLLFLRIRLESHTREEVILGRQRAPAVLAHTMLHQRSQCPADPLWGGVGDGYRPNVRALHANREPALLLLGVRLHRSRPALARVPADQDAQLTQSVDQSLPSAAERLRQRTEIAEPGRIHVRTPLGLDRAQFLDPSLRLDGALRGGILLAERGSVALQRGRQVHLPEVHPGLPDLRKDLRGDLAFELLGRLLA